ncbi:neutral protease NprB [soil metagenome]
MPGKELASVALIAAAVLAGPRAPAVQGQEQGLGRAARVSRVAAVAPADLRAWDAQIDSMSRERTLDRRRDRADRMVPGRRHTRFVQTVNGVPVYGGDVARQTDARGVTLSVFATVYDGIGIHTEPTLSPEHARAIVEGLSGMPLGGSRLPRLVILPRGGEGYALTYQARVATPGDITMYFIDAHTGAVVHQRSDAHTQAAVGLGTGVLGDRKKVQASRQGGLFVQIDRMRPPLIETLDMRGNLFRTLNILNGIVTPAASDFAADPDNDWTDGAAVDAHTYAGYTYDYFFKRFGRRGLDNADIPIRNLTHPVDRANAGHVPEFVLGLFYLNAFYAGSGVMVYGEGLPPDVVTLPERQHWNYMSGALDVVAHELTHGITDYSSGLLYENEPGALNESFSDIMGTAVEFFFQPPGDALLQADYLIAEDVVTPGGLRSMADPAAFGHPDHYSRRYTGTADNGGIHGNAGIPNQAYFLAVEGGTNRTSGLVVQGIGRGNREEMERVFYRAFTLLMPANADFVTARAATIQAARDLFGPGSAQERAVTQAWTAVGVN